MKLHSAADLKVSPLPRAPFGAAGSPACWLASPCSPVTTKHNFPSPFLFVCVRLIDLFVYWSFCFMCVLSIWFILFNVVVCIDVLA